MKGRKVDVIRSPFLLREALSLADSLERFRLFVRGQAVLPPSLREIALSFRVADSDQRTQSAGMALVQAGPRGRRDG